MKLLFLVATVLVAQLCLAEEKIPVLGAAKCTWGPGYWCATKENANECDSVNYCVTKVWKGPEPNGAARRRRDTPLPGSDACTYGPSYWCESEENAKKCQAEEHCTEIWGGSKPTSHRKRQVLGAQKCTWGPSYWCDSEENAKECDAMNHCVTKVWKGPKPTHAERRRRDTPVVVGAKKCTWGPSYWCESEDNAKECDTVKHCEENVWQGPHPKTDSRRKRQTTYGAQPCTWGPTYWCDSAANAEKCTAVDFCLKNNWNGVRPSQ